MAVTGLLLSSRPSAPWSLTLTWRVPVPSEGCRMRHRVAYVLVMLTAVSAAIETNVHLPAPPVVTLTASVTREVPAVRDAKDVILTAEWVSAQRMAYAATLTRGAVYALAGIRYQAAERARKAAAARQQAQAAQVAAAPVQAPAGGAQQIAMQLLAADGWGSQFDCLNGIIMHESSWNVYAYNPGSGAYGIPQALPGSKMAVAGSNWQSSAWTQLNWMINFYIRPDYGTPCAAWAHEQSYGWY